MHAISCWVPHRFVACGILTLGIKNRSILLPRRRRTYATTWAPLLPPYDHCRCRCRIIASALRAALAPLGRAIPRRAAQVCSRSSTALRRRSWLRFRAVHFNRPCAMIASTARHRSRYDGTFSCDKRGHSDMNARTDNRTTGTFPLSHAVRTLRMLRRAGRLSRFLP